MCIYNDTYIDTPIANSSAAIFLVLQGIRKIGKCPRQTKALTISLYSVPKQSPGEVFGKNNEMIQFLPTSLVPPSQPPLQQIYLPALDTAQLTNKCFLLCAFSEVLSKGNQKSKYENTGKTSFKKLMLVTTADIKTNDRFFLESSNF